MSPQPPPTSRGAESTAVIVVMGVSGSGKTTLGTALAVALGWRFVEADDHHSPVSVAKMTRGEPLDDDDRRSWLDELRAIIEEELVRGTPIVMACSALKASYRSRLGGAESGRQVRFVYLAGPPELFRARLVQRAGHFMKVAMLESQLVALEPPSDALTIDAALPVCDQVAQIRRALDV